MKKLYGTIVLSVLLICSSLAQTEINWSQMNSGGGAAGGSSALINGSIGGFAIGASSANNTVNASGFWTGVPTAVFSALPFLSIQLSDGSKLQLSWPVTADGFSLERATTLKPPDWVFLRVEPEISLGMKIVREEATAMHFYRLKKD